MTDSDDRWIIVNPYWYVHPCGAELYRRWNAATGQHEWCCRLEHARGRIAALFPGSSSVGSSPLLAVQALRLPGLPEEGLDS